MIPKRSDNLFLESIRLRNLLSYGPEAEEIPLGPLNVLIGPNGSGKSNLLEGISLLQAAPKDLMVPIRGGGGALDWLHKSSGEIPTASIEAVIRHPKFSRPIRYRLKFTAQGQRFALIDEAVENRDVDQGDAEPHFFFKYEGNQPFINVQEERRQLRREDIDPEQSILSQRKDPDQYPEITHLGEAFAKIKIYREWPLGRNTAPRLPQKPDLPNDFLLENAENLGLVLSNLRRNSQAKRKILESLAEINEDIQDFEASVEAGTVQVFLDEGRFTIPATRMSEGTLRYLCLLSILVHPNPPALICIEEPEMCLHPDMFPTLAALLIEASTRTQIIVTTHSDALIDALSDHPETILVCEKHQGQTSMKGLNKDSLSDWLDTYTLGQLWRRGDLGGNRW